MSSLLERLRHALEPQYRVEREITGGGMGRVFLSHDIALDRPVAIKVMRPELATAHAAERFLREARTLAHLKHPNVVPVHTAGEKDGLFYYVMDYVESETLAQRLTRGTLSTDEARKLGRDLLDGLETVHHAGVVHRDIKPSNIFVGERTLLSDFGIAKPLESGEPPTTRPGHAVGTPGYMPPEQAVGGAVTTRTDLYAVGMVLYETLTGRRWSILAAPEHADWSGVPRRLAPVLRRALAWAPEERWPDAASFRRALWNTRTRPYIERTLALAGAALVVGAVVVPRVRQRLCDWPAASFLCGEPHPSVLAIPPFEIMDAPDPELGRELAGRTRTNLEGLPDLTLTPIDDAANWRRRVGANRTEIPLEALPALQAQYVAWASTNRHGDSLDVHLTVYEAGGRPLPGQKVVRGAVSDVATLAERVANAILQTLGDRPALSENAQATREFVLGEGAFQRNAWRTAVRHYEAALALDPSFAQAAWRAWNAWQWLGFGTPYSNLDSLYREHGVHLRELDRLLIEAELAPPGRARLAAYAAIRARFPDDAYAAFLHAEELFLRGPLVGIPLERGELALEQVAARDSLLSPIFTYLTEAQIRQGRRDAARATIAHLKRIAAPPGEVEIYVPALLEQAYLERFEPERAAALRGELFEAAGVASLLYASRWGLAFDLPETQWALGDLLVRTSGALERNARANGHQAMGLALIALGRIDDALAHLDSAASLLASAEARFQAAEWRVIPPALGIHVVPERERARGRAELERYRSDPALAARADWALALAASSGDGPGRARAPSGPPATNGATRDASEFGIYLRAARAAARGQYDAALASTEPLLSRTMLYGGDPFLRAVLHWTRAEWREAMGDPWGADAEWLWYENQDVVGYPRGEAQAAEVDWALTPYARYQRGLAAWRGGDRAAACRHWTRMIEYWHEAEPAVLEVASFAVENRAEACAS